MTLIRAILTLLILANAYDATAEVRFVAVDVFIDSDAPLAAWQFEFSDLNDVSKIVGVENGDVAAFNRAPFYDRDAVAGGNADRVVVADYSLTSRGELPTGRIRVATLHLMVSGESDFASKLIVAATHGGKSIEAEISVEVSAGRDQ